MATILTPSNYPAVRQAIDISLNETTLPDAAISSPIYLLAADLEIKARDPQWAAREGDAESYLVLAAIYLTAAKLAPAVPAIAQERFPEQYSYQRVGIDYVARARELMTLADAALANILEPSDETPYMPTMFTTASGGRGT